MGAHSRPLTLICCWAACPKRAVEEVFNTYNAPQGKYCKRHAKQRVADLREGERWLLEMQTMRGTRPTP